MSAIPPLLGGKQTSEQRVKNDAIDPSATLTTCVNGSRLLISSLTRCSQFDMLLCTVPARGGSDAIRSTETARLHHAARWRGGRADHALAALGARAAVRPDAAGWRTTGLR